MKSIKRLSNEKIIVFDGAMGTSIQALSLTPDDFQGHLCNDWLSVTRPDLIGGIHAAFLGAGADVVETNTFNANRIALAEFGLEGDTRRINLEAARLAKCVTSDFSTEESPRFVSGSVGPGPLLPSLGQVEYSVLRESYEEQIDALIEGGVDMLQIETCQDVLQIRAALAAADRVFRRRMARVPVFVQVTLEKNGSTLTGTPLDTIVHTLASHDFDVLGMNCGTGPAGMRHHLRQLSAVSDKPISLLPNAGLPQVVDGKTMYDLPPDAFAGIMAGYVREFGVRFVGGCCGTTPDFIRLMAESVGSITPAREKKARPEPSLTSLYRHQSVDVHPKPLLIGERCNANGSRQFRKMVDSGDFDGMLSQALEQETRGAHVLDINLAVSERNEEADWRVFTPMINQSLQTPLMIDSTNTDCVRVALEHWSGRAIVNSTHFGEGGGRVGAMIDLCREHGAALICLAIDENGMAMTSADKVRIAGRFFSLAMSRGMTSADIFFDPLTFTLGTGEESYRTAILESLIALETIGEAFPELKTVMGISNASYGLKKGIRPHLNSVVLAECVKRGLTAAIVDAGNLLPLSEIPEDIATLCHDLIYDNHREGYDPLAVLLAHDEPSDISEPAISADPADLLRESLIRGNSSAMEKHLRILMETVKPAAIIDDHLLPAMRQVGEMFDRGVMQLPFVLKSAEVMRRATGILEPLLAGDQTEVAGKILLATVKGDIHDIGKNLVGIIMSNQGYQVIDIGVRQSEDMILNAIRTHNPTALGLSALLVHSARSIRDILSFLDENDVAIPVICGGAALSQVYVERELQPLYRGSVRYGKDAFAAIRILESLQRQVTVEETFSQSTVEPVRPPAPTVTLIPSSATMPGIIGNSGVLEYTLREIEEGLNRKFLFHGEWQLSKRDWETDPDKRAFAEENLLRMSALAEETVIPRAVFGCFPCRVSGEHLIVAKNPHAPAWERDTFGIRCPRRLGSPHLAVTDYFPQEGIGWAVFMAVTLGISADRHAQALHYSDRFQDFFLYHGYCATLAESLAQRVHRDIAITFGAVCRTDPGDQAPPGARYAFGYPCCPDLADQREVLEALEAKRINLAMNEGLQLVPMFSSCALLVLSPDAVYWK